MSFSWRPIPRWANAAGWVWVALVLAFTTYNALSSHLDFVQTVGYFGAHLVQVMSTIIVGGIALYGVVVLLDLAHGRKPPKPEKEEDHSSDVANLVP